MSETKQQGFFAKIFGKNGEDKAQKKTNSRTEVSKKYAHTLPGETFFEDVFQAEIIENNMYILKDASISTGLQFNLPADESLEESELEALDKTLYSLINQLPEGTVFHKMDIFYEEDNNVKKNRDNLSTGYFTRRMTSHFNDRKQLSHKCWAFLCFPYDTTKNMTPASTRFATFKNFGPKNRYDGIEERIEKIKGYVRSFVSQLNKSYGITVKTMNNDQLRDIQYQYFSLTFDRVPDGLSAEIANEGNKVKIGNKNVNVVHLQKPGKYHQVAAKNGRGVYTKMNWTFGSSFIRAPHIVHQAIRRADTEKIITKLTARAKQTKALSGITGTSNRVAAENTFAFTEIMAQESEELCYFDHAIMVWSSDEKKLQEATEEAVACYTKANQSVGVISAHNAGSYFFSFSPGNASDMWSNLVVPQKIALCNFNWTSMNKGEKGGILVCNRDLEPIMIDLWSDELVNKNKLTIGPSGSGKSFFTNNLITQQHEDGVDQVIIDVGASYRNLISILDGKYLEYTQENPLQLNPFLLPTDEEGNFIIGEDKKTFLMSVITIMWKGSDVSMTKEEESIISEYLLGFYKYLNKINSGKAQTERRVPNLGKFIAYLEETHEKNMKSDEKYKANMKYFEFDSLMLVLTKYTTGQYAKIFNSNDTTDISDDRLICFDMSNIKSNPELYPIVSLIIIELVLDKIAKYPYVRKELILDEAFEFLSGNLAPFIEKLFRQARKHNMAVGIVTQGVTELENSPAGPAIVQNAAIKILLDHSSARNVIPNVQRFLGLTDGAIDRLESIRKAGTWREFFVQRMDTYDVFALDVGPHAAGAFSTSSSDKQKIDELKDRFGEDNKELIFDQFAEDLKKLTE